MALRIAKRPTFRATVTAMVPTDSGEAEKQTFSVRYRLAADSQADLSTPEQQEAFLHDIIVSVDDLVDEAGDPLPWSDDVRAAVLSLPWALTAILAGYFQALVPARLGN